MRQLEPGLNADEVNWGPALLFQSAFTKLFCQEGQTAVWSDKHKSIKSVMILGAHTIWKDFAGRSKHFKHLQEHYIFVKMPLTQVEVGVVSTGTISSFKVHFL